MFKDSASEAQIEQYKQRLQAEGKYPSPQFQRLETLEPFMPGGKIYATYDSLLKVSQSISIHSVG